MKRKSINVIITQKFIPSAVLTLSDSNYNLIELPYLEPQPAEIIANSAPYAQAIITFLSDKIDSRLFDKLPCLKIVANYAAGYNNIDLEEAKKRGIIVTNTPGILTNSTADITLALILACSRHIVNSNKYTCVGNFTGWQASLFLGFELDQKILGIIGAGRIGSAVAKRAKSFGMRVIYYNRNRNLEFEKEADATYLELEGLLKISDVVSIHTPLTPATFHLLDKTRLELLKPSAILINTARGEVIDEVYLIEMLKQKRIFSAGLDVYENEPKLNHELFLLDNVVILPHLGSATFETRTKMAELAVANVIEVLSGRKPLTPVEFDC